MFVFHHIFIGLWHSPLMTCEVPRTPLILLSIIFVLDSLSLAECSILLSERLAVNSNTMRTTAFPSLMACLTYGKILYLADLICPAPSQGERAHPRDKHHRGASHKPEGEAGLEPVGTRDEKEVSTRLKEGRGPAGKELGRRFWGNIWDLGRSKELAPQQIRKGCVEFFRERPRDSLGQEGARARYGLGIEGRRGTWCEQTGGQRVKRETQVKVNRPHSYGAGVFHSERKLNPLKSFKQVHGVIWLIFQRRLPGVRKIYWRSRKEEKKRIQKIQGGCR